jgi:hypothetical protein
VVLAIDAPLLPPTPGPPRHHRSCLGGRHWRQRQRRHSQIVDKHPLLSVEVLAPEAMNDLFPAAAEATQEAILNALCMHETMHGREDRVVQALPHDLLQILMRPYL